MKHFWTVFALLISGAAVLSGRLVRRYVVDGDSMLRAYAEGDRLLAESLSYRLRAPRVGEVVVVQQPGMNGRKDLKRIAAGPGATVTVLEAPVLVGDDEWYVLGDNLSASTDSRVLGPVKRRDILARAWRKY